MVLRKCRAKVRVLSQQIDDLEKEVAAVEWYVEDTPGRVTEKEWLKNAHDALKEARDLREKVIKNKEHNICSIGSNLDTESPDLLSKKADKTSKDVFDCVQQSRGFEIPIAYRQGKKAVDGFQDFNSRSKLLADIMEALESPRTDDGVGKTVIGVHGVPGVGKTMLLRKIKRKAEEGDEFDAVVMVTVTKNPNMSRIRDEIARGVGIYPFSHELASQPQGVSNERIQQVLTEKKVLLIFDDIWATIDLEELGIALPEQKRSWWSYEEEEESSSSVKVLTKCKIVLTYRDTDRLGLLTKLGSQQNFQIFQLRDEEPKVLFDKMAADKSETRSLPVYTADLAKKCDGSPIATATLANALKGKSLIEWMITLKQLESTSADQKEICRGISSSLHSALRLAYSDLKNKEAFLLCCLLGRNETILDLLKYGTGLGLFPAVNSRKQSWDQALALVSKLRDSSLLQDGATTMHIDMNAQVRDFAVAVASEEIGVLAFRDDDDEAPYFWPNTGEMDNFKWIYFSKGYINWFPYELDCPHLTFFHLSNTTEPFLEIPQGFFKRTKKLRVLGLTNMRFSSIPSSIRFLKDLLTLRLDHSLLEGSNIGAVIGELVDLQVLSLSGCDIKELPKEVEKLTKLEVLDLSDCSELKSIPPGVLSSLVKLEELYMGNSFDQWGDVQEHEDKKNASVDELMVLNLIALEVCIRFCNTKMILESLFSEKLERYKVFVGQVWNYWGCSFESSNVLKLKLDEIITVDASVKKLLKNSDELHLEGLKGVKNVLYELDDGGFQKLKFLLIRDAPDIQHFVNSGTSDPCNAFPVLEVLVLRNLENMEKICAVPLGEASFGKLTTITVGNCDQLKYLFSFSIAKQLIHLQEIEVTYCRKIEEIVGVPEDGIRSDINAEATGEAGPHKLLRSLRLQNLQSLVSFNSCCSQKSSMTLFNEQIDFPRLEELQLSCINFSRIWNSPTTSYSIQNLTKLIIEGCDNLLYAFSSSLAKDLVKVRHLEISRCKMMTQIILSENVNESRDRIIFPNLNFLRVTELEILTGFCSEAFSIEFPSLEKMVLESCPNLEGFTVKLTGTNVMDGVQPLFNEQVSFPILESMTISHMENVRILWQSQIQEDSFRKLKSLEVKHCGKLLYVFPSNSMFGKLKSLELLSISECCSLRAVFELGGLDSKGTRAVVNTQLRELLLSHLQRLKWVWSEDPHGTLSFKNLQSVIVQYCYKLKYLFPASVAQSLPNLHNLNVHRCGVEEIVEPVREGSEGSKIVYQLVFPRGSNLHLGKLRRLKYLYSGKHQWPVLKQK